MVSPRELRLVTELVDGSETAYRPTVVEGAVVYPAAGRVLRREDDAVREVLEALAEREVLRRDFEGKVYHCPSCETEEMVYTSACPRCGSTHVVETAFVDCGGCGRTAPTAAYETDGSEGVCPACDTTVGSVDGVERTRRYLCRDCDRRLDAPLDALGCPAHEFTCSPTDAVEHALYRYDLGPAGEPWVEGQRRARRAVAAAFADRGYDVEEDATVTGPSGTDRYLHVYASDALLDERVAVAVHELPLVEHIERLQANAADLDARPVLVSTVGTVSAAVAERAEREGVTVLSVTDDGDVVREYDVTEDLTSDPSLLQRITTVLT